MSAFQGMNLTTRKVARTFARVRLLADRVKLVFPSSCARRQPPKGISPIVRARTSCGIAPCRAEDVELFLYLLGYQFLNEKPQNHLPYHIDELRRLRLQPQDWRWPSAATIMPHTPESRTLSPCATQTRSIPAKAKTPSKPHFEFYLSNDSRVC